MKFLQSGRVKEKFIDILAKGLFVAVSALFFLWMVSGAKAANNELSDIRYTKGENATEVELIAKEEITKDNVSVDFQRNFIQLSLKDVSAFPAKTVSIKRKPVEKAFSYQYQPDLARVRILLNGSSKNLESKVTWGVEGSSIRIQIPSAATNSSASSAATTSSSKNDRVTTKISATEKKEEVNSSDPDELAARSELLKGSDSSLFQRANSAASGKVESTANTSSTSASVASTTQATGEDTPLFLQSTAERKVQQKDEKSAASKITVVLAGILALIGLLSFSYKKFILGGKILAQKPQQIMEVVASQSLGKQKSISIVRVMDKHLVLGVTDHSVNILLDLGADSSIDKYLDTTPQGASFGDFLNRSTKQTSSESTLETISANATQGFRQLMKKKIEGLKPL